MKKADIENEIKKGVEKAAERIRAAHSGVKPGFKTTEFWVSMAVILLSMATPLTMRFAGVEAMDDLSDTHKMIIEGAGYGVALLTMMFYNKKRADVKKAASEAAKEE